MSRRKRHFQRVPIADPNPPPPHIDRWLRIVQWTAIVAAAVLLPLWLVAEFTDHDQLKSVSFCFGLGCAFLVVVVLHLRTGVAETRMGYFGRTSAPFRFWLSFGIWGMFTVFCFVGAVSFALGWSTPPDRAQRSQQRTCAGTSRK